MRHGRKKRRPSSSVSLSLQSISSACGGDNKALRQTAELLLVSTTKPMFEGYIILTHHLILWLHVFVYKQDVQMLFISCYNMNYIVVRVYIVLAE